MRTKYRHFTDDHGYIVNLFAVDPESRSTSNYILVDCVELIASRRKRVGELGIEGYVWVKKIVDELLASGYATEDVLWALERLLNRGLIVAQHLRTRGLTLDDYVKVTASGFFHIKYLLRRLEYVAAVATDCWYRDKQPADQVLESLSRDQAEEGLRFKRERAIVLQKYLAEEAERMKKITSLGPRSEDLVAEALAQAQELGAGTKDQTEFEL